MSTVTLELGGDAKNVVNSFNEAAQSVERLNEETKEFDKTSKKAFTEGAKASNEFGKSVNENTKNTQKEIGIIEKLEKDLKDLIEARKKANSVEDIKKLNKEIDDQDSKLKKLTGTVEKTSFSFKEIAKGALAFVGITAALDLVKSGFTKVTKVVADYDQATSQLKAITGLDDKQFGAFDAKIKQVAANTKKSAVDIAKAFQLIGSADASLLTSADALGNVTDAAITLAKAGGLEVPEAATALTKAMNQFGASADQASEFTDILAASQQKGTATISELSESMKNVGAVANAAGVSFKDTTIALQALAKGGLTGAEAGTGLRSVYSKLANQGRAELNPTLTSMTDIIKTLSGENIGLKEASALVGEESAKTLLTLIAQKGTLDELTVSMENVSGSATEQAITATDNINDKWEEFNNTIDNAIIQFASGESALGGFITQVIAVGTEIINLITGNEKLESSLSEGEKRTRSIAETLIFLVKTITIVIGAIKAYQLAMTVWETIQKAITAATEAYNKVQILFQNGMKAARAAQLAFNAAAAANPIGLLVVAVLAAVAAIAAFSRGANEAAIAQEALNAANERASRIAKQRIASINEQTAAQLKALNDEKILRAAAGEDQKKLDDEILKRQEEILSKEAGNNKKRLQKLVEGTKERVDAINKELAEVEKIQEANNEITLINAVKLSSNAKFIEDKRLQDKREALIKERATVIGNAQGIRQELLEQDKALSNQIKDAQRDQQVIVNEGRKELTEEEKKAAEKRAKEKEKELKRLADLEKKYQEDLAKLALDAENATIDQLEGSAKFEAIEKQRNKEIDLVKKNLEDQKEALGKGRDLEQEQLDQIQILRDKAARERADSQMKYNDEQLKNSQDLANKSLDLQEQIRIEQAKQFNDSSLSEAELEKARQLQILEIQAEFAQKRIDALSGNLTEEEKLLKLQLQNQANDINDQIDSLTNTSSKFSFAKLLGVSDEEFDQIKGSLNVLGNSVLEATQNIFAAQQAANDALLESIDERIDDTERALDRELELNEQGFASNVESKRAELEALKIQKEKAQKEAEELAKKQFLLDTAIQASSIITASANILKGFSTIPLVGQILGIAAVTAMVSGFILARTAAYGAIKSGSQKLAKGGKLDRQKGGRKHSEGGNRIEGTDIEVEQDEWVINSRDSNEQDKFLKRMNAGEFRNVNLDALLSGTGVYLKKNTAKKLERNNHIIIQKQAEKNANMISDRMVDLLGSVDDNLLDFITFTKNKPQIITAPWGRIEIENGKKTIIRMKGNE